MIKKILYCLLGLSLFINICACSSTDTDGDKETIIGFSQSGIESSWRKRHTDSILSALESDGYQVMYRNGLMKQEQQKADIRAFIAYKVDMIVFSPIVEDGWDLVLKEAKEAKIPVILVDRDIKTEDTSLFISHIGPNFKAEGNRAGIYASNAFNKDEKQRINILELSGTPNAYSTILRHDGFVETINKNHDLSFQIVASLNADYTRTKGEEVMRNYIKDHDISQIDIIFSHNDEMALGMLDVLDETGLKPGVDIIIISIDGQEDMIYELKRGRVNCVVECNPDAGPYLISAIERYFKYQEDGLHKEIPREIYMTETVFSDKGDLDAIPPRNY